MEKIIYQAKFSIKLASAISGVKEIEDSVNKTMKGFGCNEKMSIESDCFTADITVDRELSEKEQYKVKSLLTNQVIESMPKYDIRLKSFSRKSKQSALQSAE